MLKLNIWVQVKQILTVKNVLIAFSSILVLGVLNSILIFPKIIEWNVKNMFELRKGSWMRNIWEHYPFYLEYKIYIWNVTNPEEVVAGGIPILNEIGPYYFE